MRAFVLSGGGNLGPLQVGALRALLERGIEPEVIVGCSAGALNAAWLARDVSLEQLDRLADIWRQVTVHDVYPEGRIRSLWRLACGADSLHDNRNFYAFLQRMGMTPAVCFGDLAAPLYVTATNLRTGKLHVFGDSPHDRVLDALMASTALTPMHPPYEIDGECYVDGGTITPLPLRVALERGATEIYSLRIVDQTLKNPPKTIMRGMVGLISRNVTTMLHLQAEHDLLLTRDAGNVMLHHMELGLEDAPSALDFSQEERMFEAGYAAGVAFTQQSIEAAPPTVNPVVRWWGRLAQAFAPKTPLPAHQESVHRL